MEYFWRKITLIVGTSIITGICSGLLFFNEKYYLLYPRSPQREVTKAYYISEKDKYSKNKYLIAKKEFGMKECFTSGFVVLGIGLISISFIKRKNIAIMDE